MVRTEKKAVNPLISHSQCSSPSVPALPKTAHFLLSLGPYAVDCGNLSLILVLFQIWVMEGSIDVGVGLRLLLGWRIVAYWACWVWSVVVSLFGSRCRWRSVVKQGFGFSLLKPIAGAKFCFCVSVVFSLFFWFAVWISEIFYGLRFFHYVWVVPPASNLFQLRGSELNRLRCG